MHVSFFHKSISISGQTVIRVKHPIRVNFDGSCYMSLVFSFIVKKHDAITPGSAIRKH